MRPVMRPVSQGVFSPKPTAKKDENSVVEKRWGHI
jgi:hypothetical protein